MWSFNLRAQVTQEGLQSTLVCGSLLCPVLNVPKWEASTMTSMMTLANGMKSYFRKLQRLAITSLSGGFIKLFCQYDQSNRPLPISLVCVWFLVMTTISQLQLRCSGNDEGLGYWSSIDHPDQWALCFFFMESAVMFFLFFFSFANEQTQQNDPVNKSVLAKPICITDRVGYTHGKDSLSAIFQHKCTISLWA